MAVRSNLFATLGINEDEFVSDVLSRLNQFPEIFIRETLDRVEKRFAETPQFTALENICAEFRGSRPVMREVDLEGIRISPFFGSVMNTLFTGVSSGGSTTKSDGSLTKKELGLYYADGEFAEAMERVRLDMNQYERVAGAMMTSLADYKQKFLKISKDDFEKSMPKTKQRLEAMRALRARAIKLNTDLWERIGWCYTQAAVKDYQVNSQILKLEEEHLRTVYRNMQNCVPLEFMRMKKHASKVHSNL